MSTPYRKQKRHHFWKGVATGTPDEIDLSHLYKKKFELALDGGAKVSTAGSCFAQNIRRELIKRNCNFLDVEPAPDLLPESRHLAYGHNIFSARFGNIYTTGQLRQLAQRAFGDLPGADTCWTSEGRFYDPFRPTIEPNGFRSREEMMLSRDKHLDCVRTLFRTADVFVFTLGLTEAWVCAQHGIVFPLCPGTAAGEFDSTAHQFVNYDTANIIEDFEAFMHIVLGVNPSLKFVLTVSPVPLVATATPDHVVNATSYSKAVLRAAAGYLRDHHDIVDYFPSYEIFASPLFQGQYYEPDKRAPSQRGIDRAMEVFFGEHLPGGAIECAPSADTEPDAEKSAAMALIASQEDVCDEMLLEEQLSD